jgi:UDP-3-O-acyl-N-acetylglucosamine deacetylase
MAQRANTPEGKMNLEGFALHYPTKVSVCFKEKQDGNHVFLHHGRPLFEWGSQALPNMKANNNTTIGDLQLVEHLSAVLGLFEGPKYNIHVSELELPLFDGSAWLWARALSEKGTLSPRYKLFDSALSLDLQYGNTRLICEPAHEFQVHYILEEFGQEHIFNTASADVQMEIFPSRTFIKNDILVQHKENWPGLRKRMGIVIDQALPLKLGHGAPLRFSDELARHKILDLLGDLLLWNGKLPKLKIQIVNGGHFLHHKLLERIVAC